MLCKICKCAHSTYKCSAIQDLTKQIEVKTLERRERLLRFIIENGLDKGRLFETESYAQPSEIFGDSVKLNIFWEPRKIDPAQYCQDKFLWINYKRFNNHETFHLANSVFPNNFLITATPKKMFLQVDRAKISGIIRDNGNWDPRLFGFFPFGYSMNAGLQRQLLYDVYLKDLLEKNFTINMLPSFINFDLDFWNKAGLTDDDYIRFRKELNLYYGLTDNSPMKLICKMFGVNYGLFNMETFPIENYCVMNFDSLAAQEVGAVWTKSDNIKAVNKIVKYFY